MLFSAAEREYGAVVVLEVALDLHPVHVANVHLLRKKSGEVTAKRIGARTSRGGRFRYET